jgi:hypothetical protein
MLGFNVEVKENSGLSGVSFCKQLIIFDPKIRDFIWFWPPAYCLFKLGLTILSVGKFKSRKMKDYFKQKLNSMREEYGGSTKMVALINLLCELTESDKET